MTRLYCGNLSFITTEDTLRKLFEKFGTVESVQIMMDNNTNQSKGFGFVNMEDDVQAAKAVAALHQKEVDGRKTRVSPAEEKPGRR